MKAKLTKWAMMLIAMMTLGFTSCSEDQEIGMDLEGTWEGRMYIYADYNGTRYQSTHSQICFETDPFKFKEGSGYWIDYYQYSYWNSHNYIANHIRWRVSGGVIYVHFREEDSDIEIRDYRLNNNYFEGTVFSDGVSVDFSLRKVASPNWDEYDYYDYYDYYYAKPSLGGNDVTGPKRVLVPPMK